MSVPVILAIELVFQCNSVFVCLRLWNALRMRGMRRPNGSHFVLICSQRFGATRRHRTTSSSLSLSSLLAADAACGAAFPVLPVPANT